MSDPAPVAPFSIPPTMAGVLLTGHGGFETLAYRTDIATPAPGQNQVLIRVGAAGINNTDVNTRTGWYSKSVSDGTDQGGADGFAEVDDADGSWTGEPLGFPRIQGADCCGIVVAVGDGVEPGRVGERVLVRSMQPLDAGDAGGGQAEQGPGISGPQVGCITFGSESDGGFAQYAVTESRHALTVNSGWSDAELASLPCAYSTAEGMLHRGSVGPERVLITGASGGVGSAAIQLAKRRGAMVIAIAGGEKIEAVAALGADLVVERGADLVDELGAGTLDVVLDLVAGPTFNQLLDLLRPGGRYVTSGAIAGPIVELDVRTLYLKDLSFFGSTYQPPEVFENLISYVEAEEIRPVVAATYPLVDIIRAQKDFLSKRHVGKLVLIPPQ